MSDPNAELDAAILSVAGTDWVKTAVLISNVFDAPAFPPALKGKENLAQHVAERLYILVDNGQLEAQGNMRRWRDSNVRLASTKPSSRAACPP